jgi:hypothetical protein
MREMDSHRILGVEREAEISTREFSSRLTDDGYEYSLRILALGEII